MVPCARMCVNCAQTHSHPGVGADGPSSTGSSGVTAGAGLLACLEEETGIPQPDVLRYPRSGLHSQGGPTQLVTLDTEGSAGQLCSTLVPRPELVTRK